MRLFMKHVDGFQHRYNRMKKYYQNSFKSIRKHRISVYETIF